MYSCSFVYYLIFIALWWIVYFIVILLLELSGITDDCGCVTKVVPSHSKCMQPCVIAAATLAHTIRQQLVQFILIFFVCFTYRDCSWCIHAIWMRIISSMDLPLRWRHNRRSRVSNHQPHECLHNRLFRRRSKKTPKLRITGRCVVNSPGTGEFPAQMASDAENVSIWSWLVLKQLCFCPNGCDEAL